MADSTLEYAQALRKWEEENPWKSVALGFVPGIGAAYGGASAAAALRDPEASAIEKTLAVAGMLPGGKLLGKLKPKRDIILHEPQIERLKQIRRKYPQWGPLDNEVIDVEPIAGQKRMFIPDPIMDMEKARQTPLIRDVSKAVPDRYVDLLRDDLEYNKFVRELIPEIEDLRYARNPHGFGSSFNRAAAGAEGAVHPQMTIGADWDKLRDDSPHFLRTLGESDVRDHTGHELQHFIQHNANAPEHWKGTNIDRAGGYTKYVTQPGEMEARLNGFMNEYPNTIGRADLDDLYRYQREYLRADAARPEMDLEKGWIKRRLAGEDLNEAMHALRRIRDIGR